ncbi:MAG: response regulator [Caldisericia bacterium]
MEQRAFALIVEDEESIIRVITKKLSILEHNYIVAQNQEEANSFLEKQKFDYVLLDLKLPVDKNDIAPDLDTGFNLLQQIRAKYTKENLPIIVMTASVVSIVDIIKKGANDFIEKPFSSNGLEMRIERALLGRQIK